MKGGEMGGTVRVWRVPVPAEPRSAWLSADERVRAERLLVRGARARFVACRCALRGILGEMTGFSPASLVFGEEAHGKPYLVSPRVSLPFNAAHSGEWAVIAVTDGAAVGIDIEAVDGSRDMEGIARRYFDAAECAAVMACAEGMRAAAFAGVWTRKEAYLKARGTGIRGGLEVFRVSVPPEAPRIVEGGDGLGWGFAEVDCGSGYVCTVCVRGGMDAVWVGDWAGGG